MTRNSDFKQVVRARMAETGEGYAAARAALEREAYDAARTELLEVVSRFEPGRDYAEREVNEVLLGVHEDFAYLRRELVNYHYLQREDGRYRTADRAPERTPVEHQEIPAWEAHWLPGFLAGTG